MDQYVDFFPELALAAALLLAALAAAPLFERIRLPSPAAFLAVGMAAGLLEIAPTSDLSVVRLEQVGAVALFVILFQGGLSTGFNAARAAARPILSLGIVELRLRPAGWRCRSLRPQPRLVDRVTHRSRARSDGSGGRLRAYLGAAAALSERGRFSKASRGSTIPRASR